MGHSQGGFRKDSGEKQETSYLSDLLGKEIHPRAECSHEAGTAVNSGFGKLVPALARLRRAAVGLSVLTLTVPNPRALQLVENSHRFAGGSEHLLP